MTDLRGMAMDGCALLGVEVTTESILTNEVHRTQYRQLLVHYGTGHPALPALLAEVDAMPKRERVEPPGNPMEIRTKGVGYQIPAKTPFDEAAKEVRMRQPGEDDE